ncbi:hypothetical protein HY469_00050 [Candidatus Roizmanbacteria bacterium]|nr:hypothetical protein [Candidatus Roizmanbacteria bacterium]
MKGGETMRTEQLVERRITAAICASGMQSIAETLGIPVALTEPASEQGTATSASEPRLLEPADWTPAQEWLARLADAHEPHVM